MCLGLSVYFNSNAQYRCKRIPHQTNRPYCHNYGEHRHTGKVKNIKEEGDPHKLGDRKPKI